MGELEQASALVRQMVFPTSSPENPMSQMRQHGSQGRQPGSYFRFWPAIT